jgi:pimeloyl-ACP methyl ester carboxylesterase
MTDRLNYQTVGDPALPSILLVHGFLSSKAQWLLNLKALSEKNHLVLAELWGHGESPLPTEDAAFSIDRYIEEFEFIRLELGIGSWGIVGQSYAAGLAINYTLSHSDRVKGLVVTNSRSAFGDMAAVKKDKQQRGANKVVTIPEQQSNNRHMPIHPIYARRLPAEVKEKLVESADKVTQDAINKGGLLRGGLKTEARINELKPPFMIANGVFEKSFQLDVARLKTNIPDITVVDMQGGHAVNIEAADEFNQALLTFFGKL